jgi:hypothetical protein
MPPPSAPRLTIAIMQPYFVPYAGYFRLLAAADVFVLFDCVQFARRGWVHRNRLPNASGVLDWLTLPLEKGPQDMLIEDLRFRSGAAADMAARMERFPVLANAQTHPLVSAMRDLSGSPVDYIEGLLNVTAGLLDLPWRTIRSSSLRLSRELRGQERILTIARELGADCYLNSHGGRALYSTERFSEAGVALRFLPNYEGSFASIAARLIQEPPAAIAGEIRAGTRLLP